MATRRTNRRDGSWKAEWLAALRSNVTVAAACRTVGIGRRTVYSAREVDEEFARAWDDIVAESTDEMEREAYRRAVEGVEEPVYQRGELVGQVRRYSDQLLMFLLKARRPEVYRENQRVELAGPEGGPPEVIVRSDAEYAAEVAAIIVETGALQLPVGADEHAGNGAPSRFDRGDP